MFKEIKDPNKYEPLSPKNILAFGKLKRRKEIRIIICAVRKNENSNWLLPKFINNKTELIIIKWIVKRPLNPSIKLAPLTTNKKHKSIKIVENTLLSSQEFKKIKSICLTSIGKNIINVIKKIIININLKFGLILIFMSSKYPTKNKLVDRKTYS